MKISIISEAGFIPGDMPDAFPDGNDVRVYTGAFGEEELAVCAERRYDVLLLGGLPDAALLRRADDLFRASQCRLSALFPRRKELNILDVSDILRSGTLGKIGMTDMLLSGAGDAVPMLAEGLDIARSWFGDPVSARAFSVSEEGTDIAALTALFENGELLNLQAVGTDHTDGLPALSYELSGEKGNLAWDGREAASVKLNGAPVERSVSADIVRGSVQEMRSRPFGVDISLLRLTDVIEAALSKEGYHA